MANKKNISNAIFEIIKPIANEMHFEIWNVKFEKEGPNWFLKILIDKESGVNIDDCENFSRKIDPVLDEIDLIDHSYYLEVSSPGVERQLIEDWHFKRYIGQKININFIRPFNGYKNVIAKLIDFKDNIITVILEDKSEISFNKKEAANIKLYFDFDK